MPTDVMPPAENVAAPETAPVNDYSAYMSTLSADERQHLALTGEEPPTKPFTEATPRKEVAKEVMAVPAEADPEPETAAGAIPEEDEDHEPEYFGTAEQQKAQRRAFARIKREKAELKAENRLLREQKAEKPAVSAPAPRAEVKVEPKVERPKRPRVTDAKYDVPGGITLFDDDMDAYDTQSRAFDRQELAAERAKDAAVSIRTAKTSQWLTEVEAGKAAHKDFEAVAFSPKVPASLPMLGVLMATKGGAEIFYHLGQHPEVAAELSEETDIPGTFQTYEELTDAADRNPRLARQLGAAEALVRAAAKRIQSGISSGPKPITTTKAPVPGTRVRSTSQATGDPVEDAYARGDFAAGAKLESARDVEQHKRR